MPKRIQKYSLSQTYLILELSSPERYALLLYGFPLVLCWRLLSEENFKFIQTFKLDLLCARLCAKYYDDKAPMVEKYCFPKGKKNALSFHILPSFTFENISWPTRSPLSTSGYFMPLISEQITIKTIPCYKQVASQLPSIISGWPSS